MKRLGALKSLVILGSLAVLLVILSLDHLISNWTTRQVKFGTETSALQRRNNISSSRNYSAPKVYPSANFSAELFHRELALLCQKRYFVFCDEVGYQVHFENISKKIISESKLGTVNNIIVSKGLVQSLKETRHLKIGWSSQSLGSVARKDSYFKINEKLQTGRPVVIHVINPAMWMVSSLNYVRCPVKQCVFDMGNVTEDTDVVLVHGVCLKEESLPGRRWDGQIYVMYGRESPPHFKSAVQNASSSWRYAFNLTSTYRRDSDIMWPYGGLKYTPWSADQRPNFSQIVRTKTEMIAWLVSNCGAPSKRLDYVREMKKHVQVDIYGGCGNKTDCPKPSKGPCMDVILAPYKFYLAFENSMCPDYVTEKLFKTFRPGLNVIPVVRGGAEYGRLFPEGSYINAAWFPTAKDLALYLKNMPDEVYFSYLERSSLFREMKTYSVLCRVCDAVILQKATPTIYDMTQWMDQPCPVPDFL
ncbi:hypothetical protein Btru_005078 [Bulinus truncatus]|nr:hypothetical protein Btru_005078 [Bulinus truncatus]